MTRLTQRYICLIPKLIEMLAAQQNWHLFFSFHFTVLVSLCLLCNSI